VLDNLSIVSVARSDGQDIFKINLKEQKRGNLAGVKPFNIDITWLDLFGLATLSLLHVMIVN
jgi:hypothetical protein